MILTVILAIILALLIIAFVLVANDSYDFDEWTLHSLKLNEKIHDCWKNFLK